MINRVINPRYIHISKHNKTVTFNNKRQLLKIMKDNKTSDVYIITKDEKLKIIQKGITEDLFTFCS